MIQRLKILASAIDRLLGRPRLVLVAGGAFVALMAVGTLILATPAARPRTAAPVLVVDTSASAQRERLLAETAFRAQERGDLDTADTFMAQMNDQRLFGHLLGERYLDSDYRASAEELSVWLANYADHPQAARIRQLALRKGADKANLANNAGNDALRGDGFVDHLGRRTMPDSFYSGLARWREKNYSAARKHFAAAAESKKLSSWQQASAHYWTYRAADKLGQKDAARAALKEAAAFPVTFYGQLANQQLGNHAALVAAAPHVPHALRDHPAVQRAQLLTAINEKELAEDELRQLVTNLNTSERPAVLSIAGELGLANLQVRLASLEGLSSKEKLYASYPMPPWFVAAQSEVEPTLLLAIARQESVFRGDVKSSAGASGMMQMMPATARHVEASLSPQTIALASNGSDLPLSKQLGDATVDIHMGAQYVAMLARQPMVKSDLVRLIAAYNAGPGSVQNWQRAARNIDDPLLYIESIPYAETRNYVMQVLAHQWVYNTLMGRETGSLSVLARGQWPQLKA